MRRMITVTAIAAAFGLAVTIAFGSRAGYESADYELVDAEGAFQIRDYPDLLLAATPSNIDAKGRDGSFMRLFRFIGGNNSSEQKIAMTTPVFMTGDERSTMSFVMPKELGNASAPEPVNEQVRLVTRQSGRFAVVRFSGPLDSNSIAENEQRLRQWMTSKGYVGETASEAAGYDPPFTPGPLRRNEVLIRVIVGDESAESEAGDGNRE